MYTKESKVDYYIIKYFSTQVKTMTAMVYSECHLFLSKQNYRVNIEGLALNHLYQHVFTRLLGFTPTGTSGLNPMVITALGVTPWETFWGN